MKILIAGGTGLVGSALVENFKRFYPNVIGISSKDFDLRNMTDTFEYIQNLQPDVVIDAAARVGGIKYNKEYPGEFIMDNLQIQNSLIIACHKSNVSKFVFLGSSCVYPRDCSQPILEEYLLSGPLEQTNKAYAVAKIAGLEAVRAYRNQYGHKWISIMPTNLYGPGDNFNENKSHVIPALIRKFVDAKERNMKTVSLWGDGSPRREFMHVHDFASAVKMILDRYDQEIHINVGTGKDISIRNLAKLISDAVGYHGEILWSGNDLNGTPQKLLDISRLKSIGWHQKIELESGLSQTVDWYLNNGERLRSE